MWRVCGGVGVWRGVCVWGGVCVGGVCGGCVGVCGGVCVCVCVCEVSNEMLIILKKKCFPLVFKFWIKLVQYVTAITNGL